jgi:hemerythrin-like metal-binding protein
MWKESYKIGVGTIDAQHKELFGATERLVGVLRHDPSARKDESAAAIAFLKNYAVTHFTDEEAYQLSVGYKDYAHHKKLHEAFVNTVLNHEKKMAESNFDLKDVKEFTGTLITWLTHHVAGIDQEITKGTAAGDSLGTTRDTVFHSVGDVLQKIAGLPKESIKAAVLERDMFEDAVAVDVELSGDAGGYITYVYSRGFIERVIYSLMLYSPKSFDEIVYSVLFEISNIASGTVCKHFGRAGIFCDIKRPAALRRAGCEDGDKLSLETGLGAIEIIYDINQP